MLRKIRDVLDWLMPDGEAADYENYAYHYVMGLTMVC